MSASPLSIAQVYELACARLVESLRDPAAACFLSAYEDVRDFLADCHEDPAESVDVKDDELGQDFFVTVTDGEADDALNVLATQQRAKRGNKPHLILMILNPNDKDSPEKTCAKLLLQAQIAGPDSLRRTHILVAGHPSAEGKTHLFTQAVLDIVQSHDCSFIEFVIQSPSYGFLGPIFAALNTRLPDTVVRIVKLYSGKNNVKDTTDAEYRLVFAWDHGQNPIVVDANRFAWSANPDMGNFATACPALASRIQSRPDLLAAFACYSKAFNFDLISPAKSSTLRGKDVELKARFAEQYQRLFEAGVRDGSLKQYAEAVLADKTYCEWIADYKRGTFKAFAGDILEGPICDVLLFLLPKMCKRFPDQVRTVNGRWSVATVGDARVTKLDVADKSKELAYQSRLFSGALPDLPELPEEGFRPEIAQFIEDELVELLLRQPRGVFAVQAAGPGLLLMTLRFEFADTIFE